MAKTTFITNASVPPGEPPRWCTRMVIEQDMPARPVQRPSTGDWFLVVADCDMLLGANIHPRDRAVLWRPGQAHRYGSLDGPWCHSCTHLCGASIARSFAGVPCDEPFVLHKPAVLRATMRAIYEELADGRPDEQGLDLLIQQLARQCRLSVDTVPAIEPGLLAARRHCDSRFDERIDLDRLAAIAHMSRSSFTAAFRAAFGCSAIEHLLEVRLRNARYLLHEPALSITEIALRSGFNDLSYFARAFRKRFGCAARELRRRLLAD